MVKQAYPRRIHAVHAEVFDQVVAEVVPDEGDVHASALPKIGNLPGEPRVVPAVIEAGVRAFHVDVTERVPVNCIYVHEVLGLVVVHSGIDEFGYLVVRLEVELVVDQAGFLLKRIDGVLIFTANVPRVKERFNQNDAAVLVFGVRVVCARSIEVVSDGEQFFLGHFFGSRAFGDLVVLLVGVPAVRFKVDVVHPGVFEIELVQSFLHGFDLDVLTRVFQWKFHRDVDLQVVGYFLKVGLGDSADVLGFIPFELA